MRFLLSCSVKRLCREKAKSLTVPFIALTLVVLINALGGIEQWLEAQYEDILDNFAIRAQLSDLSGLNTRELHIGRVDIERFSNPDAPMSTYNFITDLALRRTFHGERMADGVPVGLIGITSLAADEVLTLDYTVAINFFDGFDGGELQSDEFVGLVSEDLLHLTVDGKINIGISIQLPGLLERVFVPEHNPGIVQDEWGNFFFTDGFHMWPAHPDSIFFYETYTEGELITIERTFTVIGSVSGVVENTVYGSFWPLTALLEEYTEKPPYSELLSLRIADNRDLSTFKGIAAMHYARAGPLFDTRPLAITVFDLEFYETLEPLRQNAILVGVAIPIVYIISITVGFLTSMLLTRRRNAEFAVMRSVGVSRGSIFFGAIGEQLALCAIGAAFGLSLIALFWGYLDFERPAIFIACYMLGAVFSAARAARTNVLAILRERE